MSERESSSCVPFGARLIALDGLRGLAVLAVVMFHTLLHVRFAYKPLAEIWGRIEYSAWAGVDLFFVLSGFLITGILLDSRQCSGFFRVFYARRTLRIFPLYYAFLGITLLLIPAFGGARQLPPMFSQALERQVWLWTYMQNYLQAKGPHMLPGFGHFWSLAVEEQFYWVWPLAVFLLTRKQLFYFCVVCCGTLPFVRLLLVLSGTRTWAVREYTHTRFDTLLYGAMVAIALRDAAVLNMLRRVAKPVFSIALVLLLGIAFRDGFVPYESAETAFAGYSALAVVFAAIIWNVSVRESWMSRLLSSRTLRWFGTYSYGIYIFHNPLALGFQAVVQPRLHWSNSNWLPGFCCFLTVIAASSLIAYLSFHVFEVHFLELKKYFRYETSVTASSNARCLQESLPNLAAALGPSRPAVAPTDQRSAIG